MERFEMRLEEQLLERIDRWAENKGATTRAEAVRRLLELGLGRTTGQKVHFSDGEKILILMLRDFYRHMDVSGEFDPEFVAESIWGGHTWAPIWKFSGVFHGHEDKPEDLTFVVDVLDLWDFLEMSFERLSEDNRAKLEAAVEPIGKSVRFRGFDGNNEAEFLSIAHFLINQMDRFTRFKDRDLNAHMPTARMHRRMLKAFGPIRSKLTGRMMNIDEMIEVLQAGRYQHDS